MHGARLAVIEAHDDVVAARGAHAAFDLVAGHGAANGAQHGGQLLAVAAAYLVAQQAADDSAAGRADAAAFGARIDFMDGFDHATIAAHLRRRGGCRVLLLWLLLRLSHGLLLLLWRQGGQRLCAGRLQVRLRLVRLQAGQLFGRGAGRQWLGIALGRGQPAHQGRRAHAAKQQDGDGGGKHQRMEGFGGGSHGELLGFLEIMKWVVRVIRACSQCAVPRAPLPCVTVHTGTVVHRRLSKNHVEL